MEIKKNKLFCIVELIIFKSAISIFFEPSTFLKISLPEIKDFLLKEKKSENKEFSKDFVELLKANA